MLISDYYREMNIHLHKHAHYGARGGKWYPAVLELMGHYCTTDVLDYGAGKQSLNDELPNVTSYDPAIPEISRLPDIHDIVVCLDVLEHIEPDYLEEVLLHLFAVTKVIGLFVIATRPARKTLLDGRNAHLIIKPTVWWMSHVGKYFKIIEVLELRDGGELVLYVKPRRKDNATPSKNYRPD